LKVKKKGREDKEEDVSGYLTTLRKKIREIEKESTGSHSLENSLWKKL
jgi:choline kinase